MNDEARLPLSWTAVLHMLNTQKSPFARFFNTLSHHCQALPIEAPVPSCSQCVGLLPMRIPFPEVEQHLELKCRSRRRGREVSRIVSKRWTNRLIALFGFPRSRINTWWWRMGRPCALRALEAFALTSSSRSMSWKWHFFAFSSGIFVKSSGKSM